MAAGRRCVRCKTTTRRAAVTATADDLVAEPDAAAAEPGMGVDTAVMAPVEVKGVSISPNRPTRVFVDDAKRCCQAASEGLCCLFSLRPLPSIALSSVGPTNPMICQTTQPRRRSEDPRRDAHNRIAGLVSEPADA